MHWTYSSEPGTGAVIPSNPLRDESIARSARDPVSAFTRELEECDIAPHRIPRPNYRADGCGPRPNGMSA
jgi:hypothetical protein